MKASTRRCNRHIRGDAVFELFIRFSFPSVRWRGRILVVFARIIILWLPSGWRLTTNRLCVVADHKNFSVSAACYAVKIPMRATFDAEMLNWPGMSGVDFWGDDTMNSQFSIFRFFLFWLIIISNSHESKALFNDPTNPNCLQKELELNNFCACYIFEVNEMCVICQFVISEPNRTKQQIIFFSYENHYSHTSGTAPSVCRLFY